MVNRVGFRVEGLREKVRDLEAVGVAVDDLKDAFGAIAKEGAALVPGFIRSRTGRLAGTARGNRAKSKAVVTLGRSSVPYAGVYNYGWPRKNIPAALSMQKTDERMQPIAEQRLDEEIDKAIRKRGLNA